MFKFSNFDLKIIALISMIIDHIGVFLCPNILILRYIGRISFIIYAFLIAEGYKHTKNVNKYLLRLMIIGVISQLPDVFGLVDYPGNIFIMFILSILFLMNIDSNLSIFYKILYGGIILLVLSLVPIDYGIYGLVIILISSYYTRTKNLFGYILLITAWLVFSILANLIGQFEIFALFGLIPIAMYDGNLGYHTKRSSFWFYISYPFHIAIIFTLSVLIHGL